MHRNTGEDTGMIQVYMANPVLKALDESFILLFFALFLP